MLFKRIGEQFYYSAKEVKNLRTLIITAMLIGLNMVLDRVSIQVTPDLRIGVGFLTSAMTGMLFGPIMGMIGGGITDILGCILYPRGAYFPGYTLTAIVAGLIWGLVLYRREIKIYHAFLAKGLINLFCNIGLNTLWRCVTEGQAMMAILPLRAGKNLILWPLESILLFVVCMAVYKALQRTQIRI